MFSETLVLPRVLIEDVNNKLGAYVKLGAYMWWNFCKFHFGLCIACNTLKFQLTSGIGVSAFGISLVGESRILSPYAGPFESRTPMVNGSTFSCVGDFPIGKSEDVVPSVSCHTKPRTPKLRTHATCRHLTVRPNALTPVSH